MQRPALGGGEAAGELECIERHHEPGVPEAFEGEDQNAHGVNGFKVVVCDNAAAADFKLVLQASAIRRSGVRISEICA